MINWTKEDVEKMKELSRHIDDTLSIITVLSALAP